VTHKHTGAAWTMRERNHGGKRRLVRPAAEEVGDFSLPGLALRDAERQVHEAFLVGLEFHAVHVQKDD